MAAQQAPRADLDAFLAPLRIDLEKAHHLSRLFLSNFRELAASSRDQFLPTPISDSILRPVSGQARGRHLAIDIGGTNLRVGFVELLASDGVDPGDPHIINGTLPTNRIRRHLEKSWPIAEHLKHGNEASLFRWIGECIAQVVAQGCTTLGLASDAPLPLGVSFSFPMEQRSLCEATVMAMGKGFAVSANADLGTSLERGYQEARQESLPPIKVTAIANDSVSTLVSFIYRYQETAQRRASMGLILGTGCNATISLQLGQLHPDKQPRNISVLPGENMQQDVKVTINTEWSINGSAPPLRQLGLISRWDALLDQQNESPGFQPLEYMTAGRYLGELGRIMFLEYLTIVEGYQLNSLPERMRQRYGLSTTFLSHFKPPDPAGLLAKLESELPAAGAPSDGGFQWTEDLASVLYRIAKAIQVRAAAIMAAAIIALLELAGELPTGETPCEVGVGYTGGCIVHFQDYLTDCQDFIDQLVARKAGQGAAACKVSLSPCHDGGITGAGILVAAASASMQAQV